MTDIGILHRIIQLVPEEHRDRFVSTLTKFRNVPEDDEYLVILEALGFCTVLIQEVPGEIVKILERVETGLSEEQVESLRDDVRRIVEEAIDIPSYQDLKAVAGELKRNSAEVFCSSSIIEQKIQGIQHCSAPLAAVWAGVLSGIAAAAMALGSLFWLGDWWHDRKASRLSTAAKIAEAGYLRFVPMDLPEVGKVETLVMDRGARDALLDEQGRAIIILGDFPPKPNQTPTLP